MLLLVTFIYIKVVFSTWVKKAIFAKQEFLIRYLPHEGEKRIRNHWTKARIRHCCLCKPYGSRPLVYIYSLSGISHIRRARYLLLTNKFWRENDNFCRENYFSIMNLEYSTRIKLPPLKFLIPLGIKQNSWYDMTLKN